MVSRRTWRELEWLTSGAELRKEAVVTFSEYRNYNRMELCVKGGWAQYLPVVSDLHVSLKAEEIRMMVMLRMNHEFMEYMRVSYPDTPLSEFKVADTYVRARGGVDNFHDESLVGLWDEEKHVDLWSHVFQNMWP